MALIEMTNAKNPKNIGDDGNVKTPLGNVDRMIRNGWIRAEPAKQNLKREGKKNG